MNNLSNIRRNLLILLITLCSLLVACGGDDDNGYEEEQPKFCEETVSLFGGSHSVTVEGTMLQAEWEGVADIIAARLNTWFDDFPPAQDIYREIFSRGVTYIVEVNPEGYTNFKTIGDGKTIYIALSQVDTTYVNDGVSSIYTNGTTISKSVAPNS